MGLNVHGGATQQYVERRKYIAELLVHTPGHYHKNGGDAHVRAGESGGRPFAHFLRGFNQTIEKTLMGVGTRQQDGVVVEIVADGKEILGSDVVHADGREIELRSCNGYEYINKVIDEERGDQYKGHLFKPFETEHEVVDGYDGYHGVISEVTQVERFAEPHAGTYFHELYRWLATEYPLFG